MNARAPLESFRRVLIIHGFGASCADHWFPWLAARLPQAECIALPDASAPRAAKWIAAVAESLGVSAEILPGAGHFLADDGVMRLPTLLRRGSEVR